MSQKRLDLILLERGLVSTRTKSQEMIKAGLVSVAGKIIKHPGEKYSEEVDIQLSEKEHPYVSRGGLKLEAALREFSLDVKDKRILDIGISAGGFAHCLLLHGAKYVVGVDVGSNQLAQILRHEPRITALEKTDIREVDPKQLGEPFVFFVVDVSFISLRLIIPHIARCLEKNATGVLLVKPQFEVGREYIGSGGIVRNAVAREQALKDVRTYLEKSGFVVEGMISSPIEGGDGNKEFLLHVRWLSS